MIDLRSKTCGDCTHWRPTGHDDMGLCGAVLPKVEVYGSAELVNPENADDKQLVPLSGTFRPEMHKDDPSCCAWEQYGAEAPDLPSGERSPLCAVKGCGCMRDGESEFCVEHEPEAEVVDESITVS